MNKHSTTDHPATDHATSDRKERKYAPRPPPGTSGYPEPQPTQKRPHKQMPDADSVHEPQNNPRQKPKPSS